jgi:hypothetical protein
VARARRWAAVLGLAALIAAVPGAAHAEKTIGLSSGSFDFSVEPGGVGEGEVTVSNDGGEPLNALVYVADVNVDSKGEQTFAVPQRDGASLLTTPASWFRIYMPADSKSVGNTPYMELEPGEKIPIRFEFSPPPGAAPGDHNTIIFFELFEFSSAEGSSAQVSGRLGSRVALRVTGETVEKMTVRPLEVPAVRIGGEIPFRFVVNNEGNLNERIMATAVVLDRNEEAVASSVVATDTAVLASSGKEFLGSVMANPSRLGPQTVEIRVEYLAEGSQVSTEVVERREVWLVPLWAVVLAGFLVVYGAGYFVWRVLRKRRAKGKAVDSPRRSHRGRDAEAEERRRRREERAAEATAGVRNLDAREPGE